MWKFCYEIQYTTYKVDKLSMSLINFQRLIILPWVAKNFSAINEDIMKSHKGPSGSSHVFIELLLTLTLRLDCTMTRQIQLTDS